MKSAVIYARYSCDAQTEQSIEGQLRVCQEYAERNGVLILDTYIDIDSLSVEQQKTFYATLLARILELYKKQKECN